MIDAIKHGNCAAIKLFLDENPDKINIVDSKGTPLLMHCIQSCRQMVQLLLMRGADTTIQDRVGNSPLMWAVRMSDLKLIKLLIDHDNGAAIHLSNAFERTPLIFAIETRKNKFIIDLLLHITTSTIPSVAIGYRTYGSPVWFLNKALFVAIDKLNMSAIGALANDANINVYINGSTPLMHAMQGNRNSIIQLLLVRGANINLPDKYGHTPLMVATWKQNIDILRLLLSLGADIYAQNYRYHTVLDMADNYIILIEFQSFVNRLNRKEIFTYLVAGKGGKIKCDDKISLFANYLNKKIKSYYLRHICSFLSEELIAVGR